MAETWSVKTMQRQFIQLVNYISSKIWTVPTENVPDCVADDECPENLSCRNRQCISPCELANPCATNAQCSVSNHKTKCECPEGFTGNPNINCYEGILLKSYYWCWLMKEKFCFDLISFEPNSLLRFYFTVGTYSFLFW